MKAVVFVDVQKDFTTGSLKNDSAAAVVPKIVEFAKDCVKNGYAIYATRDTHEKTTFGFGKYQGEDMSTEPQAGYLATFEGRRIPVEHCVEGTDGWQIEPDLMDVLLGNCTFVNKNTLGSLDLAEIMQEDLERWNGEDYYEEIAVCGFASVILNAILLRTKFPNSKITVMKGLCDGPIAEKREAALEAMRSCQIDVA